MRIALSTLALVASQAVACSPEQESTLNNILSWVKSKTEAVCIESILLRKIDKKKAVGVNILGNPLVCEVKDGEVECVIKPIEIIQNEFLKKIV